MLIRYESFIENLVRLKERVAAACARANRPPESVTILPVTKSHPDLVVEYVARAGLGAVGENRVQEALEKMQSSSAEIRWELIGHLQSNKAHSAARFFARIQGVDSLKLAIVLNRAAEAHGKVLPVLLQVNLVNDPAKYGAKPEEINPLLEQVLSAKNLRAEGLMTVAPLTRESHIVRSTFEQLRKTRDRLEQEFGVQLPELSMGMTGDFEHAIEEGSTLIRIGSALFGDRFQLQGN